MRTMAEIAAEQKSGAASISANDPQLWASVPGNVSTGPASQAPAGPPPTGQEALIDQLKNKFFSNQRAPRPYVSGELSVPDVVDSLAIGPPSPGQGLDKAALMERIRIAKEEAATAALMAGVNDAGTSRTEVVYDDMARRDPFEPLLKGLRSGFFTDDLPGVETLRMVGVLRDKERTLALLEDMDGHSYIMRPGDPVAHGRIVSVGEERVVIAVDEYGWTRTVVLQLTSRGADPSKSLGANAASAMPATMDHPE